MKSVEIGTAGWKNFCEEFTRLNQGTLVTIELLDPSGERVEVASNIPLDRMVFDQSNSCYDLISLQASEPGKRGVDHVIIEPIHIIVRETPEHAKVLQLTGENATTLITFHSGKLPEMVTAADWAMPPVQLSSAGGYV